MHRMRILGIDIGGTGIKGGIVDVQAVRLVTERYRVLTPIPATPNKMLQSVKEIVAYHDWKGPIGIGFPGLIRSGICIAGNNLDSSWMGIHLAEFFEEALGVSTYVANDADVAGYAEVLCNAKLVGIPKILFLTLGTGVGSALICNGKLSPGTELGSLRYKKSILENYISNRARKEKHLSWKEYGKKLHQALMYLIEILSPDQIILGGGVSKKLEKFQKYIRTPIPVSAAELQNTAGTIGAALYAYNNLSGLSSSKD